MTLGDTYQTYGYVAVMNKIRSIAKIGREVISKEADGLQKLKNSLGADFETAVHQILQGSGHLIFVGLGKSGHIARKLASSFASTGTPAFFVHPTEAAHGDLGMITPESVVIGLSNSGESHEVNEVITYAKTLGARSLCISSNAMSTLANIVDIALILPAAKEACPNELAPTTSTTMALALGDALCVSVMEVRGFTIAEFGKRHPAGRLGFGLQTLLEYISTHIDSPALISIDAKMPEVILAITSGGKGCVGVVDDNKLAGIITDGDLRRAMDVDIMDQIASDIMTSNPFVLSPNIRMRDGIMALTQRKIGSAFIVQDDKVLGLLDLKTVLATGYV